MRMQFSLLTITLFIALAAGSAWAEETQVDTPSDSTQPSNIEGWEVDEEAKEDSWTFFGMGFESRQAATSAGASGSSGTAAAGVSGVKKGKGK